MAIPKDTKKEMKERTQYHQRPAEESQSAAIQAGKPAEQPK
jgi:hypothetical protein